VWQVELVSEVEGWFLELSEADPASADLVGAAIDALAERGPLAGRPMVDRLKGSRYHNMKELRPGVDRPERDQDPVHLRPRRQAVLLVAGDKSGSWTAWYDKNIPLADERYAAHLAALATEGEG